MDKYKLPVNYTKLEWQERRAVREQYIAEQNNMCHYCNQPLDKPPPSEVATKKIDWSKFPNNFLRYPVHLQHSHVTGMTEGAVHAYCNAVMWQYEGR